MRKPYQLPGWTKNSSYYSVTDIGHVSLVTDYEWVFFVYHVFFVFFVLFYLFSLSSFYITVY